MTKAKVLLMALFLSITGTFASAEEVIFKNLAGSDWSKLEAALVQSNLLKDGRFPTSALGEVAHGNVLAEKLPGSELTKSAYITLFKMHNALGESISVEEFKKRGQAGEFTLPVTLNRGIVPPVVAATPVAAVPVAAAPAAVSLDSKALAILNGQVQSLQSQLAKGGDEKRMAHLAGLVAALQSDIKVLKGNEANFAQKADLDNLSKSLGGRMDSVEKTVSELPALVKTEAGAAATAAIAAQLTPIQADVAEAKALAAAAGGSTGPLTWAALIAAGLALLMATIAWFRKGLSKKAVQQVVQAETETFSDRISDMKGTVEVAKADVMKVTKSVAAISEEVKGLNEVTGRRTVVFPDNFDKELAKLQSRDTYTFEVGIASSDESYQLMVELVEEGKEGYVTVFGIKDQTKEVAIKNLRATIGKSAKVLEDGTSRLVGIDDTLRTVKEETLNFEEDHIPSYLKRAA
jgi:hypothetical protein